jgi:hypothetical protein
VYLIMERLVIDPELNFAVDIPRCAELINEHRNVAVGTWFEAQAVLSTLGMTPASINTLVLKARENLTPEEILAAHGTALEEHSGLSGE